jgi:hypothetical protein
MAALELTVPLDEGLPQNANQTALMATAQGTLETQWFEAVKQGDLGRVRCLIERQLCGSRESHFGEGAVRMAKHSSLASLTCSDPVYLDDLTLQQLVGNPVYEYDGVQLSLLCIACCKIEAELPLRKQIAIELIKEFLSSDHRSRPNSPQISDAGSVNRSFEPFRTRTLHLAALVGDEEIIKEALARGANRSVLNAKGKTPLDFLQKETLRNILQASVIYTPPISPMLSLPELSFENGRLGLEALIKTAQNGALITARNGEVSGKRDDPGRFLAGSKDSALDGDIFRFPLKFPGKLLLKSKFPAD